MKESLFGDPKSLQDKDRFYSSQSSPFRLRQNQSILPSMPVVLRNASAGWLPTEPIIADPAVIARFLRKTEFWSQTLAYLMDVGSLSTNQLKQGLHWIKDSKLESPSELRRILAWAGNTYSVFSQTRKPQLKVDRRNHQFTLRQLVPLRHFGYSQ